MASGTLTTNDPPRACMLPGPACFPHPQLGSDVLAPRGACSGQGTHRVPPNRVPRGALCSLQRPAGLWEGRLIPTVTRMQGFLPRGRERSWNPGDHVVP